MITANEITLVGTTTYCCRNSTETSPLFVGGQWTQTIASDGADDDDVRLYGTVGEDVGSAQQRLPAFDVRDENLVRIEVAVQATIFAMAVVGNGLVLVLLLMISRRKELGRMYTMIGHLSLADLFVAFFNILPQIIWDVTFRFRGGRVMCKLVKYCQISVLYASSFVLVATAIDRYAAICHPMLSHAWTSSAARRLVAAAWSVALLLAVPQLVIFDFVELDPPGSGIYDCWEHFNPAWTLPLYITCFASAIYFVPLLFLTIIYIRICVVVWQSSSTSAAATATTVTLRATTVPVVANANSDRRASLACNSDVTLMTTVQHSNAEVAKNCAKRDSSAVDAEADTSFLPPLTSPVACSSSSSNTEMTKKVSTNHRSVDQLPIRPPSSSPIRPPSPGSMSRAKTKTIKLTLTVVAAYAVCWGPFFVSQMWCAWDANAPFEGGAMVITMLLASLNSCTNPWIYMAFSDQLRHHLKRCFCQNFRRAPHSTPSWLQHGPSGRRQEVIETKFSRRSAGLSETQLTAMNDKQVDRPGR